jgi:GNAT superfamily N-acetyltransferase
MDEPIVTRSAVATALSPGEMSVDHFKRWKLELDLRREVPAPVLPSGFAWVAWSPSLCRAHAWVKYQSFRDEMDSEVFLSLSTLSGCRQLMHDIAMHPGFLARATWLIRFEGNDIRGPIAVATVQGIEIEGRRGSIQNVGVLQEFRGMGLGKALMLQALHGFQSAGCTRASLEVTARNWPAVELYRSLGFRLIRTSYRAVSTRKPRLQTATA